LEGFICVLAEKIYHVLRLHADGDVEADMDVGELAKSGRNSASR
jgi:hypothetical protein